ncbi:mannosyl (alpha-1,3-)-glycoprotein beta-1,4-N-acetylglucosaminyltransferase, isozyme C (putative), isoform CRA_b [Mus musculus]|nr:mannosyl (alpha-1,3-)-glycoprotein beta-1,4-N-acetylglucosaminyltransferase, isozyme C (putative), isoform CRA_b [Mus musculus]
MLRVHANYTLATTVKAINKLNTDCSGCMIMASEQFA